MKLEKKKALAARSLGIARNRVVFAPQNLSQIKEAITKQDMRDLLGSGAISIKGKKGRKKIKKRKSRRRAGSVRKKVKKTKQEYIILTRKFRSYLKSLKIKGKISSKDFNHIRKEIRASSFKNLAHLKERISQLMEGKVK